MRRQHLQLIAVNSEREKDSSVGGESAMAQSQSQSQSQTGAPQSGSARGSGRGFVVNSFEHRHRAQQQLLEQQQQQLVQQRRLIDEMAALQRQQLLQQRLAAPQRQQSASTSGQFEPTHLHAAIASIQRDVLQDAGGPSTDRTTADHVSR